MRPPSALLLSGILIAGLVLGLLLGRMGAVGVVAASSAPSGRYQLTVGGSSSSTYVYLTDTETGRVWYQATQGWEEQSPSWAAPTK